MFANILLAVAVTKEQLIIYPYGRDIGGNSFITKATAAKRSLKKRLKQIQKFN